MNLFLLKMKNTANIQSTILESGLTLESDEKSGKSPYENDNRI